MALEAPESDRAQADGKQGHGAADCQEMLAEVFHAPPGEVEEMILNRFEAAGKADMDPKESGLWPAEFWLEG